MPESESTSERNEVRTAELVACMCLATDLGMSFPLEHGLEGTLTSMRLCRAMGVDLETARATYDVSLLMYAGCAVDGDVRGRIFGGNLTKEHTHRQHGSNLEGLIGVARALPSPDRSLPVRAVQMASRLPRAARFVGGHYVAFCEVAGMLAHRLGMPSDVVTMFDYLSERWDGAGILKRAGGEDIPLPIRIVQLGRDATYQRLIGDEAHVAATMKARSGKAFDAEIVDVLLANLHEILGPTDRDDPTWDAALAAEPGTPRTLSEPGFAAALEALGLFSDTISPYFTGHSSGVAELAHSAGAAMGMNAADAESLRAAGYLHDIGRAAVHPRVWNKTGTLTTGDWEQVRLHPYHTERVLVRSPKLAQYAWIASSHHERLDASGYHKGLAGTALGGPSRVLAAADAFRCRTEPRAYRDALEPDEAVRVLSAQAEQGMLDRDAVAAVAEAAGQPRPDFERPAGLTEREAQVIELLAHGGATKQIAESLGITAKTADTHIQNIYRKIGVSSRAAATLYAASNGLVR